MKLNIIICFLFLMYSVHTAFCQESPAESKPSANESSSESSSLSLDEIINQIEKRYTGTGFSARFDQTSVIKAMDIADTAFGKVFIKHPGMMRWEYEMPDKQAIITDGKTLWVYRPEDNQVMLGSAPAYFGDGKGASFLSDIKLIREKFSVTLENTDDPMFYILKLVPIEKKFDIADIYLYVSKKGFDLNRITTHNSYGDETRLDMSSFQFNQNLPDDLFRFIIPSGADVLQLEE